MPSGSWSCGTSTRPAPPRPGLPTARPAGIRSPSSKTDQTEPSVAADSFTHGWNACRACHHAGGDLRVEGDWHIRANPGYWGASAPEVLVLGFSKGANQTTRAPG